jgi:putative phosphoesterase
MMRMLIIGDTHIPERAEKISWEIEQYLRSYNFDLVLCTGDLTSVKMLSFFESIAKTYCVLGNMDDLNLPAEIKFKIDEFKIGIIHGDQIYPRDDERKLINKAVENDLDVIISGHTHRLSIRERRVYNRKVLLLNPGSATGVWSGGYASFIPSFMDITINNGKIEGRALELYGKKFNVTYFSFTKSI